MISLRMDLHTHIYEATNCKEPTKFLVEEIIGCAKEKGLHGIAVTEHWNYNYARKICDIKEEFFSEDDFLIIPGREIEIGRNHIVEIILPQKNAFRFLAHPSYSPHIPPGVKGIEIHNSMHTIIEERALQVAGQHRLAILANSDAHYLEDIGINSTTVFRNIEQNEWWICGAGGEKIYLD